ncbi:transcriptional regulator family: C2H2 zinc finger [Paecilomyces variotii]|nr:transcriptional regulator family: C2H2 zinc finger [Paecilomyces variotii]KAJ9229028.1 transcriptional regulator family: C2H2 zinc finger [Paecilomyces variotii]KAJ9249482.1 transcriptional regulator family: C2H2 zinc finger [Paecilomyces variotii]KAJ9283157.1 transcriptional regulator family: C2H2 zinc finger [Paecilomyces variotii]KAJ9305425.1 transcriptional regulator family: C2H2 zinc finger [Paecilomyces variotii]
MSEHQDTSNPNTAVPAPVAQQPSATPQQQSQQQQQTPIDQSTANVAAQAQAAAAAAIGVSNAQNGNNVARSSSSGEDLACHWQGCSERCPTPEALYEHVCERHVGRKSTNNLNLTCQWGSCRTTTVKRDHITSHIRVHVPLKPHKCDFCGKAFKRPQDLKKHVKTHADDSVLVRSPEPGSRNPDVVFGVPGNPKGFPTGGHYFEPAINAMPPQGYSHGAPQYYHSQQPQQPSNPSYGNVYYTLSQGPDVNQASYESKKRGYEALNEFFGDLKRRQFDPSSYAAVGQRLLSLHGLQLPLINHAVPEYQHVPAAVAVGSPGGGYSPSGSMPSHGYHLPPMANARTKNDLINLDQFLEQMQATVYENDDHVAAAGVAQPGAHYVQGNMSYRTTNSPPTQLPSSHATATTTGAPGMSSTTAHSPSTGTPALTPPSSAQSYTPGRSPIHRVSPPNEAGSSMYPRLPSTTMPDSMSAGYPSTTSAAPASTLGGIFDNDDRRRYGGNNLQRARPDSASQAMDLSLDDEARTPPAKELEARQPSPEGISSSLIDPALHRSSSPDAEAALRAAQAATEAADRAEEQWVEHVRLIENLRKYISFRLENGDFEDSEKSTPRSAGETAHEGRMEGVEDESAAEIKVQPAESPAKAEPSAPLYPTLRGLEDGDSTMTGEDN